MRDEKAETTSVEASSEPKKRRRRSLWRWVGYLLLLLIVGGGVARAAMPWAVRKYVNRTLDRNPLYQGKIGQVHIHLYRGAYSIDDVRLLKTTGNVPVPLFAAKRVEFSVQWRNLLHRKVVGEVVMAEPELNFVDSPDPSETQTGAGGPWMKMLQDLFPFKLNSARVENGSVHFRTYASQTPVDVYLSHVDATVDNLTNIKDETTPLISTVEARALAMDQAKFEYKMQLDPFSYRPTFHMATRLLGLDVTKVNDLALAYGKFDFKQGWFDLVIEVDAKEGQLSGYVKPLFRNLKVFALGQDLREDKPLEFFWQALVGGVTRLLTNPPRDQFGTLIPFTGDAEGTTSTDVLATIGNVLRNAFVRAYLPRLQSGATSFEGMNFDPPAPSDPNAVETVP